jgi:hypothetical protein
MKLPKSLVLAAALAPFALGCGRLEREITLAEGAVDSTQVRVVKEIWKGTVDKYRLELYDKGGNKRITIGPLYRIRGQIVFDGEVTTTLDYD